MMLSALDLSNLDRLRKCWKKVVSNKSKEVLRSSRGIDGVTLDDFRRKESEALESLSERIKTGSYLPQPVKFVPKKKTNGEYRPIAVPTIEDRIVQRAMLDLFEPYLIPVIKTGVSYCGIKCDEDDSMNLKGAMRQIVKNVSKGKFWILKSDIVSFYDRIPKAKILENVLSALPGLDSFTAGLLNRYIYFETGNPEIFSAHGMALPRDDIGITQGSSFSPIFSNLYLADVDRLMKGNFGHGFLRYADDLMVVCMTKQEAQDAKEMMVSTLGTLGLSLSPKIEKTRIARLQSQHTDFLGISIRPTGLTLKGGVAYARKSLEEMLHRKAYEKFVIENGRKLDVYEQMKRRIISWASHYRFYHVDELFMDLGFFLEKKTKIMFKGQILNPLPSVKLDPLIPLNDWKALFQ